MSLPPPDPNSTVLITGASAGIGAELARQLGARGYNLELVARRKERLEELAEEVRGSSGVDVHIHPADLAEEGARKELIAAIHREEAFVAGVCNNAGFGSYGRFQDLPLENELAQVRLNVDALHELTGAFLSEMVGRGAGAILNLGSIAGAQPLPGNATYAASKAFANSFSEALHTDLAGTGVSCTALCPGPVETEFHEVAGVGRFTGVGGQLFWGSAEETARAGIEGMLEGSRTVAPGSATRVALVAGRLAPRSVLLPLARAFARR